MAAGEPLLLLLDADMSSRSLVRVLTERGHDVAAAGLRDDLAQLDDPVLFAVAQAEGRILITHNVRDFPDILGEWAQAARPHHGCVLSHLPTNAFAEMTRRFDRWFAQFPSRRDWIDRAVHL